LKSPYILKNIATGRTFDDTGWMLNDPEYPLPSLLRTQYQKKQLILKAEHYGFYRFADWLPVKRYLDHSAAPVTYRSKELAKKLKIENLYITFNGYWPQKGALMETCSFKELEAYSVCGRLDTLEVNTLVVASAGNTARAFARVCSDNQIPLLLCVPYSNLDALWFGTPLHKCVRLVCTPQGSDYFDAIRLSQTICSLPGYVDEGGARNVARRDGMGVAVLSAATHIGTIPDYYVQAVGSGTGAIAAREANLRLIEDGRFGCTTMKLITVQNHPFVPIFDAWKMGSRSLPPYQDDTARDHAQGIDAKVLANRYPPYSIPGGLFDALSESGGVVNMVTNREIAIAAALFEETEGIDIHPAAAAGLAGLQKGIEQGTIDKKKIVMLNITGGGENQYKNGRELHYLLPNHIVAADTAAEELIRILKNDPK
jgi:cysteate synthase